MLRNLLVLGSIALGVLLLATIYVLMTPEDARDSMGMLPGADGLHLPAVMGYANGEEVYFVHPETSSPAVAELMTEMMGGSPVLVVPALVDVPQSALARVYVFTNGVEGEGPFGFQADVFDNPPGSDGYSPLRTIRRVAWVDGSEARLLTSDGDVQADLENGEVTIELPGVVVNMPMLTWPGGQR